jgi:mono/diheme cytochrome c family protein
MRRTAVLLAAAFVAAGSAAAQTVSMTLGHSVSRPGAPSVAPTSSARSLFVLHCSGCHGRDGAGATDVPDMRQLGQFLRLDGGREFIVKVPGVMNAGLSDGQIADVTNWVLATIAPDSLPTNHRPYEATEIARARLAPLADVATSRAALIAQARAKGIELQ